MTNRRRSNRPTREPARTGKLISNTRACNELKVNTCAREVLVGMHGGKMARAMRRHGTDSTVGETRVTNAMLRYEPHTVALRSQLLPPSPANQTPAPTAESADASPAAPATPANAAAAAAAAAAETSSATPASRARLAQ